MTQSRKTWPLQREPSPISGQTYPNQQPIVGVFGAEPFMPLAPPPNNAVETAAQIIEEIGYQEMPELHRRPWEDDKEVMEAEMLLKNNREATDCKPLTITFDGENYFQIGRWPGRKTIMFFNGSANVTIANTVAGVTNTASNENWTLEQGNSASIDTEAPFWLMATSGTTVSIIQTYYDLDAMALARWRVKNEQRRNFVHPVANPDKINAGAR